MKIALFTDTYKPQINGVSNTVERMIEYFEGHGIEYQIFLPKYVNEKDDNHFHYSSSIPFLFYKDCRVSFPNILKIVSILKSFRPDIIHVMSEYPMGIAGIIVGKLLGIPVVSSYTTHIANYTQYVKLSFLKPWVLSYFRYFHSKSKRVLVPSNDAIQYLNRNGIRHTQLFTRGIDTKKFHPKHRDYQLRKQWNAEGKIVFLYVGRISAEKNLSPLVTAYGAIKQFYPDRVQLIMVGDGPLMEYCKKNLPQDTIFTGFITGDQLAKTYASADVFVFPSSSETLGNVVLEAMASGLCVIGSNEGGVGELIKSYDNGISYDSKYSHLLTDLMLKVMDQPELREYMRIGGRNFAKDRSWLAIFDSLMFEYRIVVKENQRNVRIGSSVWVK
ncbi:MAG: glycosyltransferase family 1 protein [Erysipelothrix sp.]|nr:glycosyltransferase family 1 protein [Erysipelothrix sp.]